MFSNRHHMGRGNGMKQLKSSFRKLSLSLVLLVLVYIYWVHNDVRPAVLPRESAQYADFINTWCRQRRARVDWEAALRPCAGKMAWTKELEVSDWTDASKAYLTLWDIRAAGEFSRFGLQTRKSNSEEKRVGGDSWRVHIRGPSSVSPTVIDHNNGTYEVIFLILEPGKYDVEVILEYSMCDGFKDPPWDWFIRGNAQGKYQPLDALPGYRSPYLRKRLWGGAPFVLAILPSPRPLVQRVLEHFVTLTDVCDTKCKYLWDGNGRWTGGVWKPYLNDSLSPNAVHNIKQHTLWIYGDSIGDFLLRSIVHHPLCKIVFKYCKGTYNWSYRLRDRNYTRAILENDELDFDQSRVIGEMQDVISAPLLNENSTMVLNLGLHYVQNVMFSQYKELIDGTIAMFKGVNVTSNGTSWRKYQGDLIWKTTTAINKEKYGDPRRRNMHKHDIRFLTYQRVLLYNAYATRAMCDAGVNVMDVFPLSDSYPNGTGLVNKDFDAVHYDNWVFQAVNDFLRRYYGGS